MTHNKFKHILISCLLLFSLSYAGCSNSNREPVSIENIAADLRANGYKVEVRDPSKEGVSVSLFPLSSVKNIYINDSKVVDIIINSFDDSKVAQQQAQKVTKDGKIKNLVVCIDYPKPQGLFNRTTATTFYVKDNLIVRCTKGNPYTKRLEKLLGKPITE